MIEYKQLIKLLEMSPVSRSVTQQYTKGQVLSDGTGCESENIDQGLSYENCNINISN